MRLRSTLLATAATVLSLAACERTPTAAFAPPSSPSLYTDLRTVCAGSAVPAGYVILWSDRSPSCPYYSSPSVLNINYIGKPGTQEVVCSNSPVPSPYVIIAVGKATNCSNQTNQYNTYTIKYPGYEEVVCYISKVPAGYTVVENLNSSYCPTSTFVVNNAKRIRRTS